MNHIYAYTLQTWREILHGSPTLQISKAVFGWLQIAATLPQTLGFEILRSSPRSKKGAQVSSESRSSLVPTKMNKHFGLWSWAARIWACELKHRILPRRELCRDTNFSMSPGQFFRVNFIVPKVGHGSPSIPPINGFWFASEVVTFIRTVRDTKKCRKIW